MSLIIEDQNIIGLYAFNQWFEVEKGTIMISVFDFLYQVGEKESFYNMGVYYPEIENDGYTREFAIHKVFKGETGRPYIAESTDGKRREFTRDTGIAFLEAKSRTRISFHLSEVKAFREELTSA